MQFFKFHIGDYKKATAHLTDEEDICYRRMLDRYYDTEQPFEDDLRLLARHCRAKQDTVQTILSDFFIQVEGRWHNPRADAEILAFYAKSAKAAESANARWSKKERNANALRTHTDGNATDMRTPCEPDATHNPLPITHEEPKTKTRATRYDAVASLSALGVSDQIARDWIKHRTTLKTTVTQTVIDGIAREAAKARIALSDALAMSCERGWRGFKAEWVAEAIGQKPRNGSARDERDARRDHMMEVLTGRKNGVPKDPFIGNTIEGELL
jgi:uncharacterized protein YdaU (DUF1376 family)